MIDAQGSLEVITLGRFEIHRQQELLNGGNWNRRKVCDLFKLLVSAEQHRLHREQIQEILWPASASEQAASSFGKTLHLLRRALEPELAISRGSASTYIILDRDILLLLSDNVRIDADIFDISAKQLQVKLRNRPSKELRVQDMVDLLGEFDRVLSLYGGDYLPEDLYEDWTSRRRHRLRRIYSWLLEHAAELAVACSMGQRACEYLQALLENNATDEQTHRQLMLLYARMGRRSDALNQFQVLCEALQDELSTHPLAETTNLYRAVQAGRIAVDLAAPLSKITTHESVSDAHLSTNTEGFTQMQATLDGHERASTAEETAPARMTDGVALPAQSEDALQAVLIGREKEMQRLQQAYAQTRNGDARVFVISGEPGIGKTRLAREFARHVEAEQRDEPAIVLRGHCYEMAGSLPYQPIVEVLTTVIRSSDEVQLRTLTNGAGYANDLAKIVPEIRTLLPNLPAVESSGPELERRNLYSAVAHFFNALATIRPTVVILDDLQWVDSATMQILNYLTAPTSDLSASAARPFYILLYRADEVHENHPLRGLLAALSRFRGMEDVRLNRLSEEAVQQLLINLAGHAVEPVFTSEIYRHTEGNPFFIGETLLLLVHEGILKQVEGRWQMTACLHQLALPQSVRLLIERRLIRLSPECRTTLALAAVLGRQCSSALLCAARNLSEESVAEHVDDAIRLHILVPLDRGEKDLDLSFTHDKICEVLYQWLNPLRRRTMHRQVAQAMESHYATRLQQYYGQLAYHYQMAENHGQAIDYVLKAAKQASSVYAFIDVAGYMEKALELLIGDEERLRRAQLLQQLATEIYLYIGRPDKAIRAGVASCALWHELGNVEKEAETQLDAAFALHWQGSETESITCVQRALHCLKNKPEAIRLRARAHAQWSMVAINMGDTLSALEHLQRADELHAQIGGDDPYILVVTLWARSWYCCLAGTPRQMLTYAQQGAQVCRETRRFGWEPMATYSAAWAYMIMGCEDEGKRIARETLEMAQRHNAPGAQGWAYLVLLFITTQQSKWDEAAEYADKAQEMAQLIHNKALQARVLWGQSIAAGRQKNWESAARSIDEALALMKQVGEASLIDPYLLIQAANVSYHQGQIARAQDYLDRGMKLAQERLYQQLPTIGWRIQGCILQAQGKFAEARPYFERSLAETNKYGDTVQYNLTLEAYGQFYLARNLEGDKEYGQTLIESVTGITGVPSPSVACNGDERRFH